MGGKARTVVHFPRMKVRGKRRRREAAERAAFINVTNQYIACGYSLFAAAVLAKNLVGTFGLWTPPTGDLFGGDV